MNFYLGGSQAGRTLEITRGQPIITGVTWREDIGDETIKRSVADLRGPDCILAGTLVSDAL